MQRIGATAGHDVVEADFVAAGIRGERGLRLEEVVHAEADGGVIEPTILRHHPVAHEQIIRLRIMDDVTVAVRTVIEDGLDVARVAEAIPDRLRRRRTGIGGCANSAALGDLPAFVQCDAKPQG